MEAGVWFATDQIDHARAVHKVNCVKSTLDHNDFSHPCAQHFSNNAEKSANKKTRMSTQLTYLGKLFN